MPSVYQLKPAFQALLRPAVRRLAGAGVTANQVTCTAAALSVLLGGVVALWPGQRYLLLLVPVYLFARMALNAIDGMLAREFGMKSRLGAILNELGDVVSDAALYLPLALVGLPPALVVIAVCLGIITEFAGVLSQAISGERRYEGPMGKSDRAVAFGLLCLWLGMGGEPTVMGFDWAWWYLAAVNTMLLVTISNRCIGGLASADSLT